MCTQRADGHPCLDFLPQRRREPCNKQRLIPFGLVIGLQEFARPRFQSSHELERLREFPIGHGLHDQNLQNPTKTVMDEAGPAPAEGDTDADGDVLAEGDIDGDADADADVDGLSELEGDSDVEALGLMDADGLIDVDRDGDTDALGDRDGEAEALAETDGDTDAETDAEGERLPKPAPVTDRYRFTDPDTSTRCAVCAPVTDVNVRRSDQVPAPPVSEWRIFTARGLGPAKSVTCR